jgi:hypothetical protein
MRRITFGGLLASPGRRTDLLRLCLCLKLGDGCIVSFTEGAEAVDVSLYWRLNRPRLAKARQREDAVPVKSLFSSGTPSSSVLC